jgi:hypothetical protein
VVPSVSKHKKVEMCLTEKNMRVIEALLGKVAVLLAVNSVFMNQ